MNKYNFITVRDALETINEVTAFAFIHRPNIEVSMRVERTNDSKMIQVSVTRDNETKKFVFMVGREYEDANFKDYEDMRHFIVR